MAASALMTSRLYRSSLCSSCLRRTAIGSLRYSSSEAAPPLLAKIKEDMKTAMRAKDTARLNVLRSIISEINQQASGSSPIKTDIQLLAMLKKKKAASQTAAKEAEAAHRQDLKEKEDKQIVILDEYAGSVQLMSAEDVKAVVMVAIQEMGDKAKNVGVVMKELVGLGGKLNGKPVDNKQLSTIIKESLPGQ